MKIARYYQKTLFGIFALLGMIVVSTSALYVYSVDRQLTAEYLNNSKAIARSIANSNVDVIVNKDYSQLQTIIDQFLDIKGISYVFVANEAGVIVAHTFVPGVPDEINADFREGLAVFHRKIKGAGEYVEVTAPVLAGEGGRVHVGMDNGYVALQVQMAIGKQIYMLTILFVLSIVVSYGLMYLVSRPLLQLGNYALFTFSGGTHGERLSSEALTALMERTDEIGEIVRLLDDAVYQPFSTRGGPFSNRGGAGQQGT